MINFSDPVLAAINAEDTQAMTRLHDQLVTAAAADQLLDVAYRTVDSPSARCSWRRPTKAWSGSRTNVRAMIMCCKGSRSRSARASCALQVASIKPPINSRSTSRVNAEISCCRWISG